MSTYKVKKGDSWWRIAKNHNINMKELLQLNNANEKTIIHPGQELKLQKEQTKLIPRVAIEAQHEIPSDNTRVKKPILTKRPLNVETTEQNWVEQAQAYRQTNPTIVQAAPEQPYQTNYWAFTGNTPIEQFNYQVMQNAKKGMQDAEKAVKSEKVKHTLYKGDPARTKQEGDKKDQIANLQRQLRQLGYYTKTVDGIEGDGTRHALAAAEKDGYILEGNKLINKKKINKVDVKGVSTIPGLTGSDYGVAALGQMYLKNQNIGDIKHWEQVKNDPEFAKYLYKSASNYPISNIINVAGNYLHGLINPDGKTLLDLGEGTERQAVASALYNLQNGKSGITDEAHYALGGFDGAKHSGQEFKETDDQGLYNFVKKYTKQAIKAPYHNIYGQSSDARFTDEGFQSKGDNYTFSNVWNGNKFSHKLNDGEGNMNIFNSIKSGLDVFDSGGSGKAAMETAASNRGVNTKRHKDVTDIPQTLLNKWAYEYLKTKK